jgi:hypothetical protein
MNSRTEEASLYRQYCNDEEYYLKISQGGISRRAKHALCHGDTRRVVPGRHDAHIDSTTSGDDGNVERGGHH